MADRNQQPDRDDSDAPQQNPQSPNNPGGPDGGGRFTRSMFGWFIIVGALIVLFMLFHSKDTPPAEKDWTTFMGAVYTGDMESVKIRDDGIVIGTRRDGPGFGTNESIKWQTRVPLTAIDGFGWKELTDLCRKTNTKLSQEPTGSVFLQMLASIIPYLLLLLLLYFLFIRQIRSAGGGIGMFGNFGRSRHRLLSKEHTNITFNDVAGIDEAKEDLYEIVEFLKNPKRFQRLGGRIPRGVLLVGEPGVGKTLLAKAIAGEADVPFFSISGSDFVEMFVGVGASRVRDLFKTAKEASPCIIFLDEIDAVGRRRTNDMHGGGQESAQTLNAILVEMDGFDTNDQIIVIAATNRADVLDPALTRPGRFDRQVYVPLPDIKGRYEILKVHARKVKLAASADLMRLARQTPMFSGADLAAIINEAALNATMSNKEAIEMVDLEEARDKLKFGKARKSRVIDEKEKEIVAWHEAGHALVQALETEYDPLHKVSIVSRGRMGGAAFTLPEKDRMFYGKRYWEAYLRICYGGRVAEELFCGDIGTGASMDIQQASSIARSMVTEWGMSDVLGPVRFVPDEGRMSFFGEQPREHSDKTAEIIDAEVHALIARAYDQTKKILSEKKDELRLLKDALLRYETIDGEDVKRIITGQPINKPTVTDLIASELQRRTDAKREAERRPDSEGPTAMPQPG
jgi:cell division protease FtsH